MVQITPSPLVDYVALAATGVMIVVGLAVAWLVDRRERRHEQESPSDAREPSAAPLDNPDRA